MNYREDEKRKWQMTTQSYIGYCSSVMVLQTEISIFFYVFFVFTVMLTLKFVQMINMSKSHQIFVSETQAHKSRWACLPKELF